MPHDLADSYEPLHKGHIDLATGLYVREDEDLVVRGTPALVLRRTYLSGYRVSREFGIGTTHNGELYLIGDGERFQWASLILADGARIEFRRVSRGASFWNALYEHRATPTEFLDARLGWVGTGWAMRLSDGSVSRFQACDPRTRRRCALVQAIDSDGHKIDYRRAASGRLVRMETWPDRWIAFDYDPQHRIRRASASDSTGIAYAYDGAGRLSRVQSSEGTVRQYTYTDRDEMRTIVEPDVVIENTYDANGRCIRQVNRFNDGTDPYTFEFAYRVKGRAIVQTDVTRSDGTWSRYTFSERRHSMSEAWGHLGSETASFTYERDPATSMVTAVTVTCPDRAGRPLRHSSQVRPGYEEWIKWDLMDTHCSSSEWTRRRRALRTKANLTISPD